MHVLDMLKERGFVAQVTFEEDLYKALERAGVPCELCTVEGADHATAEFSQVGLLRHIADWLDAALGKGRA